MADEVKITLEGFKELNDAFDAFLNPQEHQKFLQQIVKEAMKVAKEDAERKLGVPKQIVMRKPPKRNWASGTVAAIGLGVKNWHYLFREYGTKAHEIIVGVKGKYGTPTGKKVLSSKEGKTYGTKAKVGRIAARPFLRPALDSRQGDILERMKQGMTLALDALFERKSKQYPKIGDGKDED